MGEGFRKKLKNNVIIMVQGIIRGPLFKAYVSQTGFWR
jgi:hypothetical protein